MVEFLVSAFVTLFVVVDPVGLAPIFIGVTEGLSASLRRQVAVRAALIAAGILVGAGLTGNWLLQQLAISLSAFRIAGGLLLFSIATEMVFGVRTQREGATAEHAVEERARDLAAFPLAIPLMAGPGAITAIVLLAGRTQGDLLLHGLLLVVVIAVAVCCLFAFLFAAAISRFLGVTGNIVLSRLLGVILAALAVQFVIDGIKVIFGGH